MSSVEIAPAGSVDLFAGPVERFRGPRAESSSWKTLDLPARRSLFGRALDSLWLAYQPIVSHARSGGPPFAFEALARNSSRVRSPQELLSLAVSVDLVGDLGRVVRQRAAEALRRDPDLTLFVNIDVEELTGPMVDGDDALSEFADRVVLEVTERAPLRELPDVRQRSRAMRQRGYRFAIDDLGGGYAGLSSIALMNPDFVKVDQALVRNVDREPVKQTIVGSLVALTRQLGIGCIVEGVETIGERDALAALDCDLMQGFLFGRPGAL